MSVIHTSEIFDRKHAGLAARLAGIASSLPPRNAILLRDADESAPVEGRELAVRRGVPSIVAGKHGEFVYEDPQAELALAGLLARIGEATGSAPIAADPQSLSIFALADRLARTDVPVLITGPTGTGKEVLSRFIHAHSPRSKGSFVAINCAAIPEAMLEALLFGHQKGAFTGASAGGTGFFREADGGTLLLDEIAEMPLGLQAKLLRALQEGEVIPVGATRPIKVDVRIVACANRDLPAEVEAGRFREDLYYRLNVFPIHLPPLRERVADIAPLACSLLLRHVDPVRGPNRLSAAALAMLRAHPWPGNVRELENVMRRALVLAAGRNQIAPEHIQFDAAVRLGAAAMRADGAAPEPVATEPVDERGGRQLSRIVQLSEARAIRETLEACGGRRVDAARRLGISERTLRYRLASYRDAGIDMGAARVGAAS